MPHSVKISMDKGSSLFYFPSNHRRTMKNIWLKSLMAAGFLLARQVEAQNLVFQAGTGVITPPFLVTNGCLCQTIQTEITNGGRAVYTFTLTKAGNYVVQGLVHAPGGGANSFCVNIDSEPTDSTMVWDLPVTTGLTNQFMSWRGNKAGTSPKIFNLTPGTHQLIVRGAAANVQVQRLALLPLPAPPGNLHIVGQ
jgi:hypothetical protein